MTTRYRNRMQASWQPLCLIVFLGVLASLVGCANPDKQPVVSDTDESAADADLIGRLITDDVAYLTQLGLMRGHLWVGRALYRSGNAAMAQTHMKHPEAELYAVLIPAFSAREVPGFAEQIGNLAEQVEARASQRDVEVAYEGVLTGIRQSEAGAAIDDAAIATAVIESLLRTAAEEYAEGVVDGAIANVHEYQDARGFTEVAKQWAASEAFAATPERAVTIGAALDALEYLWPTLAPTGSIGTNASAISAAADQVARLAD